MWSKTNSLNFLNAEMAMNYLIIWKNMWNYLNVTTSRWEQHLRDKDWEESVAVTNLRFTITEEWLGEDVGSDQVR